MKIFQQSRQRLQMAISNRGIYPVKSFIENAIDYSAFVIDKIPIKRRFLSFPRTFRNTLNRVRSLGTSASMGEYEIRKTGVFNLLNFFQFLTGLAVPLTGFLNHEKPGISGWLITCLPALISAAVLLLNSRKQFELAMLIYFVLYPVFTSIIYLSGMNLGIELFFILYGILAVLFIQDKGSMLFAISLSMISYYILTVVWRDFQFTLEVNGFLFHFNHLLAMGFIFYGLYLIKEENAGYQLSILEKNMVLQHRNIEIEQQRLALSDQAALLQVQSAELSELSELKTRLFTVIAHDLKTPVYGLKNMFSSMQELDLPAEEIKGLIPDVVNELNHTSHLVEDLLLWAGSQMKSGRSLVQELNLSMLVAEVVEVMRLQAETKKLKLINDVAEPLMIKSDTGMIQLVLRNLVSNAIKFTHPGGEIKINVHSDKCWIHLSVTDTGCGITPAMLEKISSNDYFTTKGTMSESGTGLGLMLCKEFLARNNGKLTVASTEGKGSSFIICLPSAMMV